MSERMEIDVDFRTAQAVAEAKALAAALDELDKRATDTIRSMNAAEKQVEDTSRAEDRLADATRKVATASQQEADAVRRGTNEKRQATQQTGMLASATENLAGQVRSWIGGYIGLTGALRMLDLVKQKYEAILTAQNELVNKKWGLDMAMQTVVQNLQLTDFNQARRLTLGVARETAMSLDSAANLIGSGSALGYHIGKDPKARAPLVSIGQFAGQIGLTGKSEFDAMFKVVNAGKAQGYSEKEVLSILNAAGTAVGASDPREFNVGLLAGIAPALAQGVDLRSAVSQYGTLASVAPSTREGADMSRMLYTLAQTTSPEARARVVNMFGRMGKLGAAAVSADDLEAAISGDGEDAQAIRSMRDELGQIQTAAPLQDAEFDRTIATGLRTGKLTRQDADRQRALRQATTLTDRNQRVARLSEDLAQRTGKVRGAIQTGRYEAAWQEIPLDQRVEMLKGASSDPDGQAILMESLGGRHEMLRALVMAASPAGREREREIRAAIYDPAAVRKFDAAMRVHMGSSIAINAAQAAQIAGEDAEAVTPAGEYAKRAMDAGEAAFKRAEAQGKWDTLANVQATRLREELLRLTAGMSDSEARDTVMRIGGADALQLMGMDGGPAGPGGGHVPVWLGKENRLRRMYERIYEHKAKAGQQDGEGPQSSAIPFGGGTIIYQNVNVGNQWVGPSDAGMELPDRFA